jgi:hypothetical protein
MIFAVQIISQIRERLFTLPSNEALLGSNWDVRYLKSLDYSAFITELSYNTDKYLNGMTLRLGSALLPHDPFGYRSSLRVYFYYV